MILMLNDACGAENRGVRGFRSGSRPRQEVASQHIVTQRIAVGDLIMCEVLQALRAEREFERRKQASSLPDCDLLHYTRLCAAA